MRSRVPSPARKVPERQHRRGITTASSTYRVVFVRVLGSEASLDLGEGVRADESADYSSAQTLLRGRRRAHLCQRRRQYHTAGLEQQWVRSPWRQADLGSLQISCRLERRNGLPTARSELSKGQEEAIHDCKTGDVVRDEPGYQYIESCTTKRLTYWL